MEFLPAVDFAEADSFLRDKGRCLGEFRFSFRGKQFATYVKILTRKFFSAINTPEEYRAYLKDNVLALGMRSEPLGTDDEKKNVKYKNELQDDNPVMSVKHHKGLTVPYNSPCLNLKTFSDQSVVYIDGLSVATPRNVKKVRCAFPFDNDAGEMTKEEATAELWVNLTNNLAKDFGYSYLSLQDAAFLSLGYPKDNGAGGSVYQQKCPYGFPLSVLYLLEKGKFVYDRFGFTQVSISPSDIESRRYTPAQQAVYLQRANENRNELMSISGTRINDYFVKDAVNEKALAKYKAQTDEAFNVNSLVDIPGMRQFFDKCFYNVLEGRGISEENKTAEFKKLSAFCIIHDGGKRQFMDKLNAATKKLAEQKAASEKALQDLGQSPGERKREQTLKEQTKLISDAEQHVTDVFNELFFRKTKDNEDSSLGQVYINFLNQLERHATGSEENPTIGSFYKKTLKHCTDAPSIAILEEDGSKRLDADLREYSQIRCNLVAHLVIQYIFNTKPLWLLESYVTKKDGVYTENVILKERNQYDDWVRSYRGFKKPVSYNDLEITSSALFPCTNSIKDLQKDSDEKYHFLYYWNKTATDPADAFRNSGVACTNFYVILFSWKTWFLTNH